MKQRLVVETELEPRLKYLLYEIIRDVEGVELTVVEILEETE
jgi:hypothetical protein